MKLGLLGGFVSTGVIIGITISFIARNKNSVTDCIAVGCEANFECIKDGKSPTCICISGFVSLERETEGSEKVCHKKCKKPSDCRPDEVCKEDNELGPFCVASASLVACDETIRCEDPEACDLVNQSPKCKCPSNELLIVTEKNGIPVRQCLKICEKNSRCEIDEICKEFEQGIVCVASADLHACDETIRCEDPEACELVIESPKCKCPSNELLIVAEADGIPERRCRISCRTTANCEAGTLCFGDSTLTQLYCEDRDRITQCSDAVECTPETECRPTIDMETECLCTNELESTDIQSTESGSKRTCNASTCEDSDGCVPTRLCLIDKYSKQGYCQARGRECPAEVKCKDPMTCKLDTDGFAQCLCDSGYTEIEANGSTATTRTCYTQTCSDSDGCGDGELCYRFGTSMELFCADASRGSDEAVCPDMTECFDTKLGYAECRCIKGYTVTTVSTGTNVKTTTCNEKICETSNDCKTKYLCYFETEADESGICSTRLKGCGGVECPANANDCRLDSAGFSECLCDPRNVTSVIPTDGETVRRCHRPCNDTDNCFPGSICYLDDTFTAKGCHADRQRSETNDKCSRVTCRSGSECSNDEELSECFCTGMALTLIERTDSGSERMCGNASCENEKGCTEQGPKSVCFTDPYSKHSQCVEPSDVGNCDDVQCSENLVCKEDENFICGCLNDEMMFRGACGKKCDKDSECELENLGSCDDYFRLCVKRRSRLPR